MKIILLSAFLFFFGANTADANDANAELQQLQQALVLHPDDPELLNETTVALLKLRNYSAAEPLLLRSLAIMEKALGKDHPDQPLLKRALAVQLHHAGRIEEAISLLDVLGETLMQSGDKQGALEVINQIVLMNPPNVEDYRKLLFQMQNS